jgi:hypothetical protein
MWAVFVGGEGVVMRYLDRDLPGVRDPAVLREIARTCDRRAGAADVLSLHTTFIAIGYALAAGAITLISGPSWTVYSVATALYVVTLFVYEPRARRRLRSKVLSDVLGSMRRCTNCGYLLEGEGPCSECGAQVRSAGPRC